jgi:ribosomal protein S18 acetylase RimI-like enzyme
MTELVIRKPKADELDSVRMVVQTVVDETYGGLWASSPLPVDEEDWSLALVAIVDTSIVGMVLTQEEWVSDLWVLRESRGRGIGRQLLAMGEAEVAARGCENIPASRC